MADTEDLGIRLNITGLLAEPDGNESYFEIRTTSDDQWELFFSRKDPFLLEFLALILEEVVENLRSKEIANAIE